ncbi:uncharacterized protein N7482_009125 [Penicillium canariense]|uniref:Alcohol dehydrogenase-like C-terminal domain-containing protein n=1 Tax=Penicillium canariense TaxID=189055 RepID=A0A9W9LFR7_9EURO|nr:uncharacterized protein N7482_009125 [Penicillium canariense]KAJ5152647.1 hypothetical protein N7482_009125 [Penicillium canariense]
MKVAKLQLKVLAVGVSQQVRNRADAKHPVTRHEKLPVDPSIDGVVLDESTGDLYYVLPRGPRLFAERVNIKRNLLMKLPPGTDPVKVAGLSGSWLTSWAMLKDCSRRKVVILGATTCAGRASAQIARWLAASAIIGISDDKAGLEAIPELTMRVPLTSPMKIPNFQGIDIVIDFIGGDTGLQLLGAVNCSIMGIIDYIPAWGPRGPDPFVMPRELVIKKSINIVDPALASWRLTGTEMKETLAFAVHLMATLPRMPFDIVSKPMSDVDKVWNEEKFKTLKSVLVLVP